MQSPCLFTPNPQSKCVEVIDMGEENFMKLTKKKPKRPYEEIFYMYQNAWVTTHPWSRMKKGDIDTIVDWVQCVI